MSNWKKHKVYCRGCQKWYDDLQHKDCRLGEAGSVVWINLGTFHLECDKCNYNWLLEENTFHCRTCGTQQKTYYQDSVVAMQTGDRVIATDGQYVYVLTRSGSVVVGRRSFDYDSYVR